MDSDNNKSKRPSGIAKVSPRYRFLFETCELHENIQKGEGAFGRLIVASQLQRKVAIKLAKPNPSVDKSQTSADYAREAIRLGKLDHQNVPTVYGVGETDDEHPFIAMEYFEGEPLIDVIGSETKPPESVLVEHFLEAVEAVDFAHNVAADDDGPIYHNDLKPDNILVNLNSRQTRVIDWGGSITPGYCSNKVFSIALSKHEEIAELSDIDKELSETIQRELDDDDKARNDIFCLGATLFFILNKREPFHLKKGSTTRHYLKGTTANPLLNYICHKAMALDDATSQYPTVRHLANDLRCYLGNLDIPGYPYPIWHYIKRWISKHWIPLLTAMAILAVITKFISMYSENRKLDQALAKATQDARVMDDKLEASIRLLNNRFEATKIAGADKIGVQSIEAIRSCREAVVLAKEKDKLGSNTSTQFQIANALSILALAELKGFVSNEDALETFNETFQSIAAIQWDKDNIIHRFAVNILKGSASINYLMLCTRQGKYREAQQVYNNGKTSLEIALKSAIELNDTNQIEQVRSFQIVLMGNMADAYSRSNQPELAIATRTEAIQKINEFLDDCLIKQDDDSLPDEARKENDLNIAQLRQRLGRQVVRTCGSLRTLERENDAVKLLKKYENDFSLIEHTEPNNVGHMMEAAGCLKLLANNEKDAARKDQYLARAEKTIKDAETIARASGTASFKQLQTTNAWLN